MIGIYGGSFNPVHTGHLIIAEYVREEFNLEKIIFIPAKNPPHKTKEDMAPEADRYQMVRMALSGNPFFEVSDIELKREGYSYTVDTLRELHQHYSGKQLFFLCGADSIINLSSWHNYGMIFRYAAIIAAGRPQVPEKEFRSIAANLKAQYNAQIICSTAPFIEISSTEIRNRIRKGKTVRYMLPEKVYQYIQNHPLY